MNRLFHKFSVIPVSSGFNLPSTSTFVSSTGMSSAPTTPTTTTPSWGLGFSPAMRQQLQGILSGSTIMQPPEAPATLPQYRSPVEAARRLMEVHRTAYSRFMGSIGQPGRVRKEAEQLGYHREIQDIERQLRGFGVPGRLIPR